MKKCLAVGMFIFLIIGCSQKEVVKEDKGARATYQKSLANEAQRDLENELKK